MDTASLLGAVRSPVDVPSLACWIRAAVHPFDGPLNISQFSHGQSNPTYRLDFADGHPSLVLRKKPDGPTLPSAHAVEREFRVLTALHAHSTVPVPRPVALCEDVAVLGVAFYLMAFVPGRVFLESHLPQLSPAERFGVYAAMVDALARIHAFDWKAAGLADFSRPGGYAGRQVKRWTLQSAMAAAALAGAGEAPSPALDSLGEWLAARAGEMDVQAGAPVLVHGDFRLDNLVFSITPEIRVVAVLDWELCTVGDPRADVGYALGMYALLLEGLGGAGGASAGAARLARSGIPPAAQFNTGYARALGKAPLSPEECQFFTALAAYRLGAIQQGVLARAMAGNASSACALEAGALFRQSAARGWALASGAPGAVLVALGGEAGGGGGAHPLDLLPCSFSPKVRCLYDQLEAFVATRVLPAEAEAAAELAFNTQRGARWQPLQTAERLKREARELGLWNAWLSPELGRLAAKVCGGNAPGLGLSTLEYAPLAELTGRSGLLAPEALNCSAPDTGNMELLIRFGNFEQQTRWLAPLLAGNIRSCYAMTEPDVASSDASGVALSIEKAKGPGGEAGYRLHGRKWWVSGAGDPRCRLCLVLGRMVDRGQVGAHGVHSVLLVPMESAGLTVVRPLTVFGYDDAPHGHCEMRFADVWVPASAMLLGEGRGFEMAQARLGPGRVHHCMRALGLAERCLEAMCRRAKTRSVFGGLLADKASVHDAIAFSRAELDSARLLTLSAAHCMDRFGNRTAAQQIALIKLAAPLAACAVIDRAMQLWGGAGVSQDTELAYAYAAARTLRLADGPDAVHARTVARAELLKARL